MTAGLKGHALFAGGHGGGGLVRQCGSPDRHEYTTTQKEKQASNFPLADWLESNQQLEDLHAAAVAFHRAQWCKARSIRRQLEALIFHQATRGTP